MRIAVCVSGQPRSLVAGYNYLEKNLLNHYEDVKIFIHTWHQSYAMETDIEDIYGFEMQDISVPLIRDAIEKRYPRVDNPAYPAYNTYSMWYSVFHANLLKKQYEDMNGFKFDVVIRTRFDYALNKTIDFKTVEPGKVYVPNCRISPHRNFCSDMFAYGTSEAMDLYSNTYVNLDMLYSRGVVMNGEHMLSANLQAYGLVGDNMVYVDMNNPFPPGPYNGNWHSIIREDFDHYKAKGR